MRLKKLRDWLDSDRASDTEGVRAIVNSCEMVAELNKKHPGQQAATTEAYYTELLVVMRVELRRRRPLLSPEEGARAVGILGNRSKYEHPSWLARAARKQYGTRGLGDLQVATLLRALTSAEVQDMLKGRDVALCLLKDGYEGTLQDLVEAGERLGDQEPSPVK